MPKRLSAAKLAALPNHELVTRIVGLEAQKRALSDEADALSQELVAVRRRLCVQDAAAHAATVAIQRLGAMQARAEAAEAALAQLQYEIADPAVPTGGEPESALRRAARARPQVWKPRVGETLEGRYAGSREREGQYGTFVIHALKTDDGRVFELVGTKIDQAIRTAFVEIGGRVRITCLEAVPLDSALVREYAAEAARDQQPSHHAP